MTTHDVQPTTDPSLDRAIVRLQSAALDRMILTSEIQDGRVDDVSEIAKRIAPFMRTE